MRQWRAATAQVINKKKTLELNVFLFLSTVETSQHSICNYTTQSTLSQDKWKN